MCIFGIAFMTLAFLTGVPLWLPHSMRRMRMLIFRQMFGSNGIELPNKSIDASETLRLYGHSDASGVSKGSMLSELFFYWFYPGPQLHQELMEHGLKYDAVNRMTRKIVAVRPEHLRSKLKKHFQHHSAPHIEKDKWTSLKLTRWLFPTFASLYYELIFDREGDPETIDLLTAYVSNDLRTRKCLELRDLPLRLRARDALQQAIDDSTRERLAPFSRDFTDEELATYLLVNFFASGVIQLSEALAHVLLEVGRKEEIRSRLAAEGFDGTYGRFLVKEILRFYPLFDSSHRILRNRITLANGETLEKGTILYLNHVAYNRAAYADGDTFNPDRWNDANLDKISIAFGVKSNRGCPALAFATNVIHGLVSTILERYDFRSIANHSRPIATFAPCYVKVRETKARLGYLSLIAMKFADDWRSVAYAVRQVVLGKYMAWDALRTRPMTHFFDGESNTPQVDHSIRENSFASLCPHLAAQRDREAA